LLVLGVKLPKKIGHLAFQAVLLTGDFGPTFVRVCEFSLGDTKPGAGGASFEWTARGGGNRGSGFALGFCVGFWWGIFWSEIFQGEVL